MIFPGISTATNRFPLLGAGQTAQNSDPPRAVIDRSVKRPAAVKRPPRRVRVYVIGLPTPTILRRAVHGKALMSVPALPVAPRTRVRVPTHRPTSGVSRSHGPRMVQAQGTLSGTAVDFRRVGPTVHRRPLPGHVSHHRSNRNARHLDRWLHRRRSRSYASTTADAHRGRRAPLPDLHSTHRHAAMSDPDQEPAGDRVFERFWRRKEDATAAAAAQVRASQSSKAIARACQSEVHATDASDACATGWRQRAESPPRADKPVAAVLGGPAAVGPARVAMTRGVASAP